MNTKELANKIILLRGQGLSDRVIAVRLGIAESTVTFLGRVRS